MKSEEVKSEEVKSGEVNSGEVSSGEVSSGEVNSKEVNSREVNSGYTVLLSREEVLAMLTVLKLGPISNLGEEPIPELTPEQRAYGLIVAERGLRARGLAGLDEEGGVRFPNLLLSAVGTCALADRSIFVTQMDSPTNSQTNSVSQIVVHRNGRGSTIHTPLDGTVHQFVWHTESEHVARQIEAVCGLDLVGREVSENRASEEGVTIDRQMTDFSLSVEAGVLQTAAEAARSGDIAQATTLLTGHGIADADAETLTNFLAAPHTTTAFQRVTPLAESGEEHDNVRPFAIQSTTFLHNDRELLVVVDLEPTDEAESRVCLVQSASAAEVRQRLGMLLS